MSRLRRKDRKDRKEVGDLGFLSRMQSYYGICGHFPAEDVLVFSAPHTPLAQRQEFVYQTRNSGAQTKSSIP